MVEQLGIRRLLAAHAEVVWGRDDGLAEEMEPDAVRPDTRGERVLVVGDPLRELKAAAALRDPRLVSIGDELDESARHDLARLVELAAIEHACVHGAAALGGAHRDEVRFGRLSRSVVTLEDALEVAVDALGRARAHELLLQVRRLFAALACGARLLAELGRARRLLFGTLLRRRKQRALLRVHRRAERNPGLCRQFDETGRVVVSLRLEGAVARVG